MSDICCLDKPTFISSQASTSAMAYGVDRELYYKEDCSEVAGKVTIDKTTYLGNYEKNEHITDDKTVIEHKYYIGDIIVTQRSDNTTDTFYLHKDHQGSVIATTTTNQQDQAEVVSQAMYDPFGKRTSVYLAAKFDVFTYSQPTDRGYTGHKMLSALDIIHMNGRIYDPTLGRFLQADPHVQAPSNLQNYNRYSYVLNNPLSYTDPSGYFFKKLLKGVMKATGTWAIHKALMRNDFLNTIANVVACTVGGPTGCAAMRFAQTFVATGSLNSAIKAGATTLATAQVFQKIGQQFNGAEGSWNVQGGAAHIATHAVVGGILADVQGGKFGHGFWSAGLTKAANVNGIVGTEQGGGWDSVRVIVAATIGGTVSELTGGKFANGAITAAFAQAFNGNSAAKRDDAIKQFKKLSVEEQKQVIVGLATDMAERAANIVDSSGVVNPNLPEWLYKMVRGYYIHREFSALIDRAGIPGFRGEGPSYLLGEQVGWGFTSSSRPDATFGPIDEPYLAFELKTGFFPMSVPQATKYSINLPSETELVHIQPWDL